ncbi:NUDIX hydrolase [Mesorhizobium humile]|uniref:NUDIX domain-containing protein n=1 Tax=Mesorhizobium humile TaxID=3072313 RepID=A0ABU4Y9R3_9HYPH|nr:MULTISPECIES: NUDIX domain-containing protein [unclassified Mesorhizobium]MDX8458275.1 NUDIX domain-containing protein [Mesorhizobium sp. VK2D]MDX8483688.1 NUDIX domain-containing protein [Mesorhizobium sp. VK2B]
MNETDFLKDYDPSAFQRPSVAVDLVLLGIRDGRPAVLLLKRDQHPHAGRWALPGGFVGIDESLDAAAARVLREKAGMAHAHLEQLYTFGAVDRDPRMRIISVAYLALLTEQAFEAALRAMPMLLPAAIEVPWAGEVGGPVDALSPENEKLALAFDHAGILATAMRRLRGKLDYSDVAFALLPELFTLRQLQDVHEAILGAGLNKPAFRRRQLDRGWLAPTGAYESGAAFRPAELYRFQPSTAD